jgi:hypothetical protein
MAKEKTTGFFFKMSPEEEELFEKRMAQTGISNKSAFIRKMCIDGHVIKLDLATINEIQRLLGISGNNLNQLTRRVNSGGAAYREDIAEINEQYTQILKCFGDVLMMLSEFATAKPGKRFIPPPTIRDLPGYSSEPTPSKEEAV